jgi:hypothetical protein
MADNNLEQIGGEDGPLVTKHELESTRVGNLITWMRNRRGKYESNISKSKGFNFLKTLLPVILVTSSVYSLVNWPSIIRDMAKVYSGIDDMKATIHYNSELSKDSRDFEDLYRKEIYGDPSAKTLWNNAAIFLNIYNEYKRNFGQEKTVEDLLEYMKSDPEFGLLHYNLQFIDDVGMNTDRSKLLEDLFEIIDEVMAKGDIESAQLSMEQKADLMIRLGQVNRLHSYNGQLSIDEDISQWEDDLESLYNTLGTTIFIKFMLALGIPSTTVFGFIYLIEEIRKKRQLKKRRAQFISPTRSQRRGRSEKIGSKLDGTAADKERSDLIDAVVRQARNGTQSMGQDEA